MSKVSREALSAVAAAATGSGRLAPIPAAAGIGLRAEHEREVVDCGARCAWLEVNSENYFGPGGGPLNHLLALRERFPISLHGVGLGLGDTDPIDSIQLTRLTDLITKTEPALVSEHLCWSAHGGRHFNDLLPLPYTEEAVTHVADRISRLQDTLGRRILVENVASYLEFAPSEMSEWEFLDAVAARADCDILLDVNNIYVNACNHGYRATEFIAGVDPVRVLEIHLAGHTRRQFSDGTGLRIDTHDQPVSSEVWDLFRHAIARLGPRPTLIEWDAALPPLATLEAECSIADHIMEVSDAELE